MREKIKRIAPLRVEDTMLLEDLCDDRDGRVHGVRDDEDKCLRRSLRDPSGKVAHDACVDLPDPQCAA